MTNTRQLFRVRARGPYACFSRPECKVERVSYSVMTPSAARGVLESILWKPAMAWRIHEILVLAPIRFISIRRNEVNQKIPLSNVRGWMKGKPIEGYYADGDRAQRNTLALRDVDYAIVASFSLTDAAGPDDNEIKFAEMFRRRLERGQHFQAPYLGCREFAARVDPYEGTPPPLPLSQKIGSMLLDLRYGKTIAPVFFEAEMKDGVVAVPSMTTAGGAS